VSSNVVRVRTTSLDTTHIFTGDFNFKGLTARRLYKPFGVKGLKV
jgi:hypothetical protein